MCLAPDILLVLPAAKGAGGFATVRANRPVPGVAQVQPLHPRPEMHPLCGQSRAAGTWGGRGFVPGWRQTPFPADSQL